MQGVTAKNPHHAQDGPPEGAVAPNGGDRIFGAGRVIAAAGGQKGGDANLIGTDQDDKKSFHHLRE